MAQFDRKFLMKKYGWDGKTYSDLMEKIVIDNHRRIAQAVLTTDQKRFNSSLKKIVPKSREKKIVLPNVGDVLKNSPTVIKAQERGKLINKTLRDKIRADVLGAMQDNGINNKNGSVNKNVTRNLRKRITKTFEDYTKKDPTFKKPSNIEAIAVTESKTVINTVRNEYASKVADETYKEGFTMVKRWVHNRAPGGMPRQSHQALDGVTIGINDVFKIVDDKGVYYAHYPHDQILPASHVITCRCELAYTWRKVK